MSNDEVRKEVRTLVAKIIKLPEEKVKFDADLFADLNVDSLVGMTIFAALDKQYGIEVPEDQLKNVRTLNDLTELVTRLVKRK